jgi:hypothetical protein
LGEADIALGEADARNHPRTTTIVQGASSGCPSYTCLSYTCPSYRVT